MNLPRKMQNAGTLAAVAFLALFGVVGLNGPVVRQALAQGIQLLTSLTGTEQFVLNYPCTVSCGVTSSTVAGYVRGTSLLYTTSPASGDASTTNEQTLASYALPANTLKVGSKLIIRAAFSAAANGNNKTMKCYFGAASISSGAVANNNKNTVCEMIVSKTGTNAQTVYATMQTDVTPITPVVTLATETDTAAITIKATGTNGTSSAGDIIMEDFSVELLGL